MFTYISYELRNDHPIIDGVSVRNHAYCIYCFAKFSTLIFLKTCQVNTKDSDDPSPYRFTVWNEVEYTTSMQEAAI